MAFSVARILLLICAPAVVAASDSARQLRGSLATESGAHLDLQAHLRLVGACKRSSVPGSKQVSFLDIRENTEKKDHNLYNIHLVENIFQNMKDIRLNNIRHMSSMKDDIQNIQHN